MKFSLEITMKTDLSVLPKVKDVYITMLPGNNFKDVSKFDERFAFIILFNLKPNKDEIFFISE